jgi:hypothetical protein
VTLELVPVHLKEADRFVERYHRHLGRSVGGKFAIGAATVDGGVIDASIVGVVVVGRPVARHFDDGWTLEVNRLATDGTPHAGSMLYAAAWRATRALGYRRLITYTLRSESGSSLRAAGWRIVGERGPRKGWTTTTRPRVDHGADGQGRLLWEILAAPTKGADT